MGERSFARVEQRLTGRYSDYPYTTVPNQVHRIFRAQQLHDRKHYDARMSLSLEDRAKIPYIDYLRPIIADADTGYVNRLCILREQTSGLDTADPRPFSSLLNSSQSLVPLLST